jgi:tetraacyldisaccharide 4'-kinase
VISIGALSMGGAGKTPLVAHMAARLRAAGRNPAILTRGYKRRSPGKVVVVPRGQKTSTDVTGDEAQMFVRAGDAHVGVGGNRYDVGRRLEDSLHPGVFLLDDGFQHVQLARQQNLVLIDALDPLAGGVFPLGRLREPPEHLARATAFILTRVSPGRDTTGIQRLLARYNAQSPVFRSRVVPREWVDLKWGTSRDVAGAGLTRVGAFCGLGNPQSFWRTLEELGIEIGYRWHFDDHHRYRPMELKRVALQAANAGADTLVTTEKDVMNLCEGAAEMVKPMRLLWLKIGVEIEEEEKLIQLIS